MKKTVKIMATLALFMFLPYLSAKSSTLLKKETGKIIVRNIIRK
jgi:hypothetical protein